jgi:hypothetical protein
MSIVCQAYLKAETADVSLTQDETMDEELEAFALLSAEFFVHAEVECVKCHTLIDLLEAEIMPAWGFACLCSECHPYAYL